MSRTSTSRRRPPLIPGRLLPFPMPGSAVHSAEVRGRLAPEIERLIGDACARTDDLLVGVFDGESQVVMVVSFCLKECGRLAYRAAVIPPGHDDYETAIELPTAGQLIDDLKAGGSGLGLTREPIS